MTATADKAKRRVLTPEERVAKLEAELAEARAKAEAVNQKRISVLNERRSNLVSQIEERQAKVRDIDAELASLGVRVDEPRALAAAPEAVNG